MHFQPTSNNILWLCSTMAHAVLLIRLFTMGLYTVYRVLTIYLFAVILRFAVSLGIPQTPNAYGWLFVISQPVMWVLEVLVLLELCSQIFRNHQGLARWGRSLLVAALSVSILVAILTGLPGVAKFLKNSGEQYSVLFYYTFVERAIDVAMTLFVLFIVGFLFRFPISLKRNLLVYFAGWAVSFIATTAAVVIPFATGHRVTPSMSAILIAISLISTLWWVALITKKGEGVQTASGYFSRPEDREMVRRQLEGINAFLAKSRRQRSGPSTIS